MSAAAGVPRGYYRAFAHWLAGRGYATLTYDYRGIGGSRLAHGVRADHATMRDWALLDMAAAIAAAQHRRGRDDPSRRLPLLLIGHSFGGNAIGFCAKSRASRCHPGDRFAIGRMAALARPDRPMVAAFFGAWVPATLKVFGACLAGRWAGAQPMPAGVARDWSAWGLRRGAHFSDPAIAPHNRFAKIVAPVHLWSIEDDWAFAPRSAVDALAGGSGGRCPASPPAPPPTRACVRSGISARSDAARAPGLGALLQPIEGASPALGRARSDRATQLSICPPSTAMVWPVTQLAASARNITTLATLRAPHAPRRDARQDALVQRGIVLPGLVPYPARELDRSRRHAVDPHTLGRQRRGLRQRVLDQGRLHCAIRRRADRRRQTRDRRDVHDRALAGQQVRHRRLRCRTVAIRSTEMLAAQPSSSSVRPNPDALFTSTSMPPSASAAAAT
jgi:predicted alpha/beta hydrolase